MEIKQEIAQVQKRPETFADIRKETEARFRELVEAWMQRRSTFQTTLGAMQVFNNVFDRLESALKREMLTKPVENVNSGCGSDSRDNSGDCAKLLKTVDLRFDICRDIEQVLKIGRDYQNKDGYRGAHYDTVKLLCDAIEYQQEQLKTKTEVGNVAALREALKLCVEQTCKRCRDDAAMHGNHAPCLNGCETMNRAKAALAAPARNCDRFASAEEAWDAYDEWVESYRSKGKTEPFNEFGWLFAPAQEGGRS